MNDWNEELRKSLGEKIEADEKIEIEKDHDDLDPEAGRAHLKKTLWLENKEIAAAKKRKNGIEVVPVIENQKATENQADPGNAAGSDLNRLSDDEKSADHAAEARKETKEKICIQVERAFLSFTHLTKILLRYNFTLPLFHDSAI
jgi:hypothetical protein